MPSERAASVVRQAILDRLTDPDGPRVVSIVAPAGYGKSTLLGQWADRVPRAAYLRLDEGDDDPVELLSDIAGAVRDVDRMEEAVLARMPAPGTMPSHLGFRRLIDALSHLREPLVLMLDDAHHVTSRPSADTIGWLMERVPPLMRLAVAGRTATAIPTARLSVHDQLLRVEAEDLRFAPDQTREMAATMGTRLSTLDMAEVETQTEGWPIAVYLALLARRSGGTRPGASRLRGAPLIDDFVRSELLGALGRDDQTWLLQSSLLEVLSGPLCDAAMETTGSLARLRRLERSNLLIHPLDDGVSYRLHPLLRDVLEEELEVQMPGRAKGVLRRASAWCAANGAVEEAIGYAHATGDLDLVAPLVAGHVWALHWSGRLATVDRWVRWFDEDGVRERYPAIAVLAGFMQALEGHRQESELWLAAAARSNVAGPMPDGTPDKGPWIAMLRGMTMPAGLALLEEDARIAHEGMAGDSPFMPGVRLLGALGIYLAGSFDAADRAVEEAVQVAEARGAVPGICLALGLQASLALRRGDARTARLVAERGIRRVAGTGLEDVVTSALLYATGARAALAAGALEEARTFIGRVNRSRPRLTSSLPWLSVLVRLETIRACIALADVASARTLLKEIDEILAARPDLGLVNDDVEDVRRAVAQVKRPGAARWTLTAAELRLLAFLPTHLSFAEIADRLFVSTNTIKSQAIAIYGKLGASTRSEAIEQAVAVGLIDESALRYPPTLRFPVDTPRDGRRRVRRALEISPSPEDDGAKPVVHPAISAGR